MTSIPLVYSFWFMLVAYVVHILDESLLGGSFVDKVREHWWPQYSWRKFFWFNTAYLLMMAASIVLYDRMGQNFLFLPLAWAIERFFNAIWHLWWTVHFKEYSPGLLTTLLIWMQVYFIVFCRPQIESFELLAIGPDCCWVFLPQHSSAFTCHSLRRASTETSSSHRPVTNFREGRL